MRLRRRMSMGIAMLAAVVRLQVLTLLLLPAALIPSQAQANNYTASNDAELCAALTGAANNPGMKWINGWSVAATFEGGFPTWRGTGPATAWCAINGESLCAPNAESLSFR